jgi:hypothetical protein
MQYFYIEPLQLTKLQIDHKLKLHLAVLFKICISYRMSNQEKKAY